jgi:hypothetical protein
MLLSHQIVTEGPASSDTVLGRLARVSVLAGCVGCITSMLLSSGGIDSASYVRRGVQIHRLLEGFM